MIISDPARISYDNRSYGLDRLDMLYGIGGINRGWNRFYSVGRKKGGYALSHAADLYPAYPYLACSTRTDRTVYLICTSLLEWGI